MKIKSLHHRLARCSIPILTACSLIALCGTTQAAVSIVGTFSLSGGIYTYSYSVTNSGSPDDLTVITIPIGESVIASNLTFPTGFDGFADSGAVLFFEDALGGTPQTFGPDSTVEFFTYDSTAAPFVVTYTAQDTMGVEYTGQTIAAVPEPSGLLLIAASALPMLAVRRRRIA